MYKQSVFGIILPWLVICCSAMAKEKSVKLFVALCDNESQGIVPVPEKIGDGDTPADNLYWGSGEGVRTWFKQSANWNVTLAESVEEPILESFTARHVTHAVTLTANAYRGSAIRRCTEDFEHDLRSGQYDFVGFIGHNGLMDFELPAPATSPKTNTSVAVICCKSNIYFRDRITSLGGTPVLLTEQFMYPGAFIIHDVLESWAAGGTTNDMRTAAGKAYAKNQRISVKAATGVFTDLKEVGN